MQLLVLPRLLPRLTLVASSARTSAPSFIRFPGLSRPAAAAALSTSSPSMAPQEYRLKDVSSLKYQEGVKQEVEVEGVEDAKVLLLHSGGKVQAVGPKCTHYGAPLKNGVLTSDGRITCPWHGACFNVHSGDVEDAPALDSIATFSVEEKNGAVYVTGEQDLLKAGRHVPDIACTVQGQERIVVVGGGGGAAAFVEGIRLNGFKGPVTVLSAESPLPFDRPKLSKGLIGDLSKVAWRTEDFYKKANIDIIQDEATSVDFPSKVVKTAKGGSYPYTKLVLATGGTPRSLPLPGLKAGELKNVFLMRTIAHVQQIMQEVGEGEGKNVVVIGSSFIGLEVGNALAGKKHNVHIIGMESEPAEHVFGAKVGKVFRGLLEKNGVQFHMKAGVDKAKPSSSDSSKAGAVLLKDGTELPADVVIEGVGVGPATGFLKESPGAPQLEKDGSISVSEKFEVPGLAGVYAIGDIATYPYMGTKVRIEHWNVAQNAGRTVSRAIAKPNQQPKPFVPVFWSALGSQLRYCGNTMASGGYDDVIIDGDTSKPAFAAYYVKGDQVVAVATMGKDPVMVQSAELMRRGSMLSRKDLEGGKDVLSMQL